MCTFQIFPRTTLAGVFGARISSMGLIPSLPVNTARLVITVGTGQIASYLHAFKSMNLASNLFNDRQMRFYGTCGEILARSLACVQFLTPFDMGGDDSSPQMFLTTVLKTLGEGS